jgi:hypothetical protein
MILATLAVAEESLIVTEYSEFPQAPVLVYTVRFDSDGVLHHLTIEDAAERPEELLSSEVQRTLLSSTSARAWRFEETVYLADGTSRIESWVEINLGDSGVVTGDSFSRGFEPFSFTLRLEEQTCSWQRDVGPPYGVVSAGELRAQGEWHVRNNVTEETLVFTNTEAGLTDIERRRPNITIRLEGERVDEDTVSFTYYDYNDPERSRFFSRTDVTGDRIPTDFHTFAANWELVSAFAPAVRTAIFPFIASNEGCDLVEGE